MFTYNTRDNNYYVLMKMFSITKKLLQKCDFICPVSLDTTLSLQLHVQYKDFASKTYTNVFSWLFSVFHFTMCDIVILAVIIIPPLDESRGYIGILMSIRHTFGFRMIKYRSTKSFQTLKQCCGPLNTG